MRLTILLESVNRYCTIHATIQNAAAYPRVVGAGASRRSQYRSSELFGDKHRFR